MAKRVCQECRLRVTINSIQCSSCEFYFHEHCSGIERSKWSKHWLCLDCTTKEDTNDKVVPFDDSLRCSTQTPSTLMTPPRHPSGSDLVNILKEVRSSPFSSLKSIPCQTSSMPQDSPPSTTSDVSCQTNFVSKTTDFSCQTPDQATVFKTCASCQSNLLNNVPTAPKTRNLLPPMQRLLSLMSELENVIIEMSTLTTSKSVRVGNPQSFPIQEKEKSPISVKTNIKTRLIDANVAPDNIIKNQNLTEDKVNDKIIDTNPVISGSTKIKRQVCVFKGLNCLGFNPLSGTSVQGQVHSEIDPNYACKTRCELNTSDELSRKQVNANKGICKYAWRGICKKEESCKYLHLCKNYYLKNECSVPGCKLLHSRVCDSFRSGLCFGECSQIHLKYGYKYFKKPLNSAEKNLNPQSAPPPIPSLISLDLSKNDLHQTFPPLHQRSVRYYKQFSSTKTNSPPSNSAKKTLSKNESHRACHVTHQCPLKHHHQLIPGNLRPPPYSITTKKTLLPSIRVMEASNYVTLV